MPVAIIADSHLDGPGGDPGPLIAQLDGLSSANCERLVLLGDLFHIWLAFRRFETRDVGLVVEALDRVRERGVPVHYVEGNRDFFLERSSYETRMDSVGTELAFTAGGKRYLAVHGDGLNDSDYMYRMWRFLSKSRVSRFAAGLMPKSLASGIIHRTERKLSKTNFKHKVEIPERVIREYGERRLAEGHDVLLLGHFHAPHRWRVEGGEVWLLDAWFRTRRVEWLAEPAA